MTENERLTIDEIIQHCNRTCENTEMLAIARGQNQEDITSKGYWEHYQVANYLEELKQYRAIGTVEELQKAKEQYDDIHSVAEKTALCGLCGYATAKEAVITEVKRGLEYSLKEYQKIGTAEEFKALKEKSVAKKPIKINIPNTSWCRKQEGYECPSCHKYLNFRELSYCCVCGQKLDWQ